MVELLGEGRGALLEMLGPEPGDLLVPVVRPGRRAALPVDEQVVALGARQLLDPGEALPPAGRLRERDVADRHPHLVLVLEHAVGSGVHAEHLRLLWVRWGLRPHIF